MSNSRSGLSLANIKPAALPKRIAKRLNKSGDPDVPVVE